MNLIDLNVERTPVPAWGPTGKEVYERTYSRTKEDGTKETWDETVRRVVDGNLALVDKRFIEHREREELYEAIRNFHIIPAGRHLWMSGVEGRQFLFNCYVSGWGDRLSEHFTFTFNQLMEGGGVGANYSREYVNPQKYPVRNLVTVELYCDPTHENYSDLVEAGLLANDSFEAWRVPDSREGWVRALEKVIDRATEDMGRSVYYDRFLDKETGVYCPVLRFDLSGIRPSGQPIKTFGGTSAGPVPLAKLLVKTAHLLGAAWEVSGMHGWLAMELDHEIANCVVSGNVRRSARMSIMHWNDPDIEWFLNCKQLSDKHWSTNISVEIDDEFISYLDESQDKNQALVSQKALRARRVYLKIIEGMLTNGEPGIWNSSLANIGEPNRVSATNPCGEICLEEWENCNLGHVNLSSFVTPGGSIDHEGVKRAHRLMARFLIRATFGDISNAKTRGIVDRNRRVGVGHFGYAGFLAKLGIKFSNSYKEGGFDRNGKIVSLPIFLNNLKAHVFWTAQAYCHKLRIPMPVKLTTVAPTGTIAKLPGETEGIHPPYAKYFIRRVRYSTVDPDQAEKIREFKERGYHVEPDIYTPNTAVVSFPTMERILTEVDDPSVVESVDEISLKDMLNVQRMYQTFYADNAVSFTVNVPEGAYSVSEVAETLLPFLPHLKGTTLMVDGSREQAPYERITEEQAMEYQLWQVDDSYDENCASGACPVR